MTWVLAWGTPTAQGKQALNPTGLDLNPASSIFNVAFLVYKT